MYREKSDMLSTNRRLLEMMFKATLKFIALSLLCSWDEYLKSGIMEDVPRVVCFLVFPAANALYNKQSINYLIY